MRKDPLGFATTRETAEFFGLLSKEVTRLAQSGEWPSWVIAGKRVFDLDEVVKSLASEKVSRPNLPSLPRVFQQKPAPG